MRSRRSDGMWIVFLGLLGLYLAASALPQHPKDPLRITIHRSQDAAALRNLELSIAKLDRDAVFAED